jgi:uracil-DNA glycosylase
MNVQIHPSWAKILKDEFEMPYFKQLALFLQSEKSVGKKIFPKGAHIFNAFNLTPYDNLKVVIIGQDPYHGEGQAHGLSFSVLNGKKLPPSLKNIFKEIESDIGVTMPANFGNLTKWASQGVLMLNSILTVRANEPSSHSKYGWTQFTDAVIKKISEEHNHIVFMLWGNFAKAKSSLINPYKHYILSAAHPSPFSADKGFFGCKHFSKTNSILIKNKLDPIDWKISPES